jgi:hypothetical protein
MKFNFSSFLLCVSLSLCAFVAQSQTINREAVVKRHNVKVHKIDSLSSLTVGNGNFAFTVDATGMQSFPEAYAKGVPLGTQSAWGWHSFPNTENLNVKDALKTYDLEGRKISYTVQVKEPELGRKTVDYFRVNPHRLQLGNIGLEIKKKDGSLATVNDIQNIKQELNVWTGVVTSSFTVETIPVKVITAAHQQHDAVSFRIESPLLNSNRIAVRLRFPYPNGQFKDVGDNFKSDDRHRSTLTTSKAAALIQHTLDTTNYYVDMNWTSSASIKKTGAHYFVLQPTAKASFECSFIFSEKKPVDFSATKDARAFELERRVVLSQYLTKVNCSSAYPPQETGLTYNSWFGKPHLEMHWWHAVHFAQWGRPELMEKSLDWYFTVAEKAKLIAKRQGFEGVRWQKMTDNNGDEAPSSVGAFLIWQQPHFIYMAEMLYRHNPNSKTLNKYKDLLFATADFMASFPSYNAATKKYNLGKGLIPAQECFDAVSTFNPTYELSYWSWALEVAQQWRIRSGLQREKKWDEIINNLAPLPQIDGVYLAAANTPDCYTKGSKYLTDHPAVLGAYSTIPAANGLDTVVMKKTYFTVLEKWDWNETWGWDYPLMAMTAARLHMGEEAVHALLMPVRTNTYLINGQNYQDDRLTIYLPGNGGVLNAVALMCTGADADKEINIGFPKAWKVKWEGLKKMF